MTNNLDEELNKKAIEELLREERKKTRSQRQLNKLEQEKRDVSVIISYIILFPY